MSYKLDTSAPVYQPHSYNGDQQGDCWISPVEGGFDVRIKFVNNKDYDGDHYSCDVIFRDVNNVVSGAAQFKAGLNGKGIGGVNEREETLHVLMTPEVKKATRTAEVEFGQFDEQNDSEIWKAIKDFAEKVVKYYQDPKRD